MVEQGLCTMTSCKGGTVQSCFQGATQPIIGYITSKGGILEKMWVVDGLHSNLVSVRSFTRQGYQAVFNDHAMQILNQANEVINEGQLDPKTDLYVIDLTKLLRPPCPLPAAFTSTRFHPKAIRMAKELHNATKHIPYSTMATMIEDETWTDIHEDVTPALLRHLARQNSCKICALTRWKQISYEGTGVTEYMPGEAFAVDYQS